MSLLSFLTRSVQLELSIENRNRKRGWMQLLAVCLLSTVAAALLPGTVLAAEAVVDGDGKAALPDYDNPVMPGVAFLTLLPNANGAVCLDGSPPGYVTATASGVCLAQLCTRNVCERGSCGCGWGWRVVAGTTSGQAGSVGSGTSFCKVAGGATPSRTAASDLVGCMAAVYVSGLAGGSCHDRRQRVCGLLFGNVEIAA